MVEKPDQNQLLGIQNCCIKTLFPNKSKKGLLEYLAVVGDEGRWSASQTNPQMLPPLDIDNVFYNTVNQLNLAVGLRQRK